MTELAVTEHLFRFRQADALVGGFWDDERVPPALAENMAEYWKFHATADLDAYVECARRPRTPGFRWSSGWRSTTTRAAWTTSPTSWPATPSTSCSARCTGSAAGASTTSTTPPSMAEWSVRQVDACWDAYTEALEELAASGACDVLAHPDLIKAAGHIPDAPAEWWDRIAEAAVASGMAAEVSSAGWRKPAGEQYPALGLLERFVARRRAVDHGLGRTPAGARGRPGRRPARPCSARPAPESCRATGAAPPTRSRCQDPRRGRCLMPTPAELALSHTDLKPEELEHLQRLLGSWSVLADLSFSDLLLLVPVHGAGDGTAPSEPVEEDPELVVLGQMRPNNRPTLVDQDLVGQTVNESQWTLVAQCLHSGEIVRGSIHHPILGEQVPVENIPVRFDGHIIGALLRVSLAPLKGPTSMYERTYLDVFERLADMVAQSAFPFPDEDVGTEESPRVGDGVVVVDADGRVEFASPNAMNAFHRMGIYTQPEGRRFGDLDVEESAVEWALATGRPVVEEVERRPDVIVLVHCIPLLSHGVVTGAMILLRDVTDVRRLDRLLLSKDAAIREVHHRVEEQPADDLVAAEPAGAPGGRPGGPGGAARGRAPGALHRPGARDPVAGPERPGALRRDRQLTGADGRGLGGLVPADRHLRARRPRRASRPTSPRRSP